jgi:hypothetical protein
VGRGEEFELERAVAVSFGLWVQRVSRNDDGGGVGGGAAWLRDAAACAGWEAEERGEVFGGAFFDEC